MSFIKNCRLINCGVSSSDGEMALLDNGPEDPYRECAFRLIEKTNSDQKAIQTISMNSLIDREITENKELFIVKIDIEGGEVDLIAILENIWRLENGN